MQSLKDVFHYCHCVSKVGVDNVISEIEGCFAPAPLLPLRAIEHRAPVGTLHWVKMVFPGLPNSGPRLVRAWVQKALIDFVLQYQMAL